MVQALERPHNPDVTEPGSLLNIAYIGNFRWAHCTEMHVTHALHDLGHDVTLLQEDQVTVDTIERVALDADLLLFTRTWGRHDPTQMHALWRRLTTNGIPTVSYHLDLYVGLARQATIPGDPFWATEWVFHPDGSPQTAHVFTHQGINHRVLPPAVAAGECVMGSYRPGFTHDIVFVGSALPYGHTREWPFRDRFVGALHNRYGPGGFAHYGPGGIRTVRNGLDGDYSQLNDLYASARVVVGDCIDRPGYVSDRLTETLGRGGFLVFPRSDAVDALGYVDGVHYIGYRPGNLDSLLTAVDLALALPDTQRDRIRVAAMTHTRLHHTFAHRMAVLLDTVGV